MRILSAFLFLLLSVNLNAQSPGDTIKINVFDYNSSTRDTIAQFPINSSISYQKVIMKYGMRCKGARVSTGSNRNLGCGEWDYSCNTYISDSTRADSLLVNTNKYQIVPDTNSSGLFSSTPTWEAKPQLQKLTSLMSVSSSDSAVLGGGVVLDSQIVNPNGNGKTYILLTQSELLTSGLLSGNIHGFALENQGGSNNLKQLRLRMKATALTNLANPDTSMINGYQEVYFHNTSISSGWNNFLFHTPFNWNGTSNLLLEMSYQGELTNGRLDLKSQTKTIEMAAFTQFDESFDMFQGNYIEANNYYGISGSNPRAIEAWIKTSDVNGEIVSWGQNSSNQKFSFRIEGAGRLRLEINGGYTVGTRAINDGQWHHVVLSFSGTNMYDVRFYIDGAWDFASSVQTRPMNTGTSLPVQISKGFHNRYFKGDIDEVRIWSTGISLATVRDWMYKKLDNTHPDYSNLDLYYSGIGSSSMISDESTSGNDATFKFAPSYNSINGIDHFKAITSQLDRPNVKLYQGNYNINVQNDTIVDTITTKPYTIIERTIYSRSGSVRSDSIGEVLLNYWNSNNTVYDLNGVVVQQFPSSSFQTITNQLLPYFNRQAMKLEIMSFVTPYGINLDLGVRGKAWYYDVTDFLPVLSGNRRITLERGGQNQEEMDIDFYFIVGTPPKDVKDIKQIWRVDQRNYQQIINDDYYEPRTIHLDTSAFSYKIKSAVTGHGQQGEFIPRNHFININGGPIEFTRLVWKECAKNPVYPQGGTWIYDRAGWCPGMATDISEYDITNLVTGDTVNVDYGVQNGSGDSRYIVSNQLVSYGDNNFQLDARFTRVIRPNNQIEFGRSNPICEGARVTIENSGATTITAASIEYWVNNGIKETYNWSGSISPYGIANIDLPTSHNFWNTIQNNNNQFHARIINVNGVQDNYIYNDSIKTNFRAVDVLSNHFYVQLRTNNAANESRYDIRDSSGTVLFQRNGMLNNTTYRDTFNLPLGCYSLNVYDSDDDGLEFFANNDGIGNVRIGEVGIGIFKTFDPDFGDGIKYNFTLTNTTSIEERELESNLLLYPNPAKDLLYIETSYIPSSQWKVFNSVGALIIEGTTSNTDFESWNIDLEGWNSGIYFIQIGTNESIITKRFIVSD